MARIRIQNNGLPIVPMSILCRLNLFQTPDLRVDGVGPHRRLRELGDGVIPVVLRVDDKDDGAAPLEDFLRVEGGVDEVDLAGKVPYGELDEGRVGHVLLDDLIRALEEEGLVRRHLVEDNLVKRLRGIKMCLTQNHTDAEIVATVDSMRKI